MIKNLVFSGGSLKGFCFLGVVQYLEENQKLNDIETIVGTSVGSCIAMFLNIGYTSAELKQIFLNIDVENYRDIDYDNLFNFFSTYGLDKGDNIMNIFKVILKKKYDENITFKELYIKTQQKLIFVGTCLNDMESIYYSYETFPEMKIIDALRISFSIPFIFEPIKINNKIYVDGGLTNNYAIDLFKDDLENTLGIIVTDTISKEINNIEDFFLASITTNYIEQIKSKIKIYEKNTIQIVCNNVNFINFSITKEKKQELIQIGYDSSKQYYIK